MDLGFIEEFHGGRLPHPRGARYTSPRGEEVGRALIVSHLLLPLAGEGAPTKWGRMRAYFHNTNRGCSSNATHTC
jgi:hypothetical protein